MKRARRSRNSGIEALKKLASDTRGLVWNLSRLTAAVGAWVLLLIRFYETIRRHLEVIHTLKR